TAHAPRRSDRAVQEHGAPDPGTREPGAQRPTAPQRTAIRALRAPARTRHATARAGDPARRAAAAERTGIGPAARGGAGQTPTKTGRHPRGAATAEAENRFAETCTRA